MIEEETTTIGELKDQLNNLNVAVNSLHKNIEFLMREIKAANNNLVLPPNIPNAVHMSSLKELFTAISTVDVKGYCNLSNHLSHLAADIYNEFW